MEVSKLTMEVKVDAIPALAEMASLVSELCSLFELTAENLKNGFELVPEDSKDGAAAPASDLRTVFKPTDQLVGLVAALRAWNSDARARIGLPVHKGSSE